MNILIPGGAGYIGSWLVPQLLAEGHKVTVYDTMWFGNGDLPDNENLTIIKGDIRDTASFNAACKGKEVCLYFASISNNAMYGVNWQLTHEVNALAFPMAYEIALRIRGMRFIYASSVAVADPTSDYAKDKLSCERFLGNKATIVRSASVCGYSTHQRLDLTVNMMAHHAMRNKIIKVNGGDQMRSHIHIQDICDFYKYLLAQDARGIYTVVSENQAVKNTAKIIADITEALIITGPATDQRSYISAPAMLDFVPKKTIADATQDLKIRFDSGYWPDSMTNEKYQNINRGIH